MGSFWSDFLDNITPDSPETLSKPFAAGMTAVAGLADRVVPDEYQTRTFTPSSYMAGYVSDNRMADRSRPNAAGQAFKPLAALTLGPVETTSMLLTKAESLGYGRPSSVVAQSMNRFNPLYEDGLQLSDFQAMWDKSRNDQWEGLRGDSPGISPAQGAWWGVLSGVKAAGAAKDFNQFATAGAGVLSYFHPAGQVFAAAGVAQTSMAPEVFGSQFDSVKKDLNIYDPEQQKKLYGNTLFSVTTGLTDTVYQIYGVGKAGDAMAKSAYKAAGLDTKIDSVRDVHRAGAKMMDHLRWVETGGAEGKPNIWGRYLEDAAQSTNVADIAANPLFKGSPRALEIGSMLENVRDPLTVAKVWAADHGDGAAIAALMRDDPDFAWRMADMPLKLQLQAAMDNLPTINRDNAEMIGTIYDRALERPGREFYKTARDIFLATDDDPMSAGFGLYNATTVNSRSKPVTGVLGGVARTFNQNRQAAALGEGWNARFLGPIGTSEPTSVILQWVGGRRPQGHVNLSGMVPTDAADEVLATVGRIKWMRGTREWNFLRDGEMVPMTGPQYRQEMIARLGYAQRQGETAVWNELVAIDEELISAVVQRFGLTPDEATRLATEVIGKKNASVRDAADVGFFFDASGNRVIMNPSTQRQLADSYVMFPIEEFAREARMIARGNAQKGSKLLSMRHAADRIYEVIQKYVRTEQLIRVSYMKNSIVEPIGSRLMAEGVNELIPLSKDFSVGLGRWFVNRARQTGAAAYWAGDKLHVTGSTRINREAFAIHNERMQIQAELDALTALQHDAELGRLSPAQRAAVRPIVEADTADLVQRLEAIQRRADVVDPGWRSTPGATPSFRDVRQEVMSLHRIVSDPARVERLRLQLAQAEAHAEAAAARSMTAREATVRSLRAKLDDVESRLAAVADPTTAEARDLQRLRAQQYRNLRYMEQRLAGARKALAGEGPDPFSLQKQELSRQIADLQAQRDTLAATMDNADGNLGFGVSDQARQVQELDAQIASLQQRLDGYSTQQLGFSPADEDIVRLFPQQIDELRAELGDWAPPSKSAELESAESWLAELRAARDDEFRAGQREIAAFKRDMPAMKPDETGALRYYPTDDELATIKARAEQQVASELDDHMVASNGEMRRMPYEFDALSMTPAQRAIFENEGLVPLSWAKKFLLGGEGTMGSKPLQREELWAWLDDGTTDVADAVRRGVQVHGSETELAMRAVTRRRTGSSVSRKPIPADVWEQIKNGEITDLEVLKSYGKSKWARTAEQDQVLSSYPGVKVYNPQGNRNDVAEWIPVEWAIPMSKRGQSRRLEQVVADELDSLTTIREGEYDDYVRAVSEREAQLERDLSEFNQVIGSQEQTIASLRSQQQGVPTEGLLGVFDPVPGPFNQQMLQAERKRLQDAIKAAESASGEPAGVAARVAALRAQVQQADVIMADPELMAQIEDLRVALDTAADLRLARPTKVTLTPQQQMAQLQARLAKVQSRLDAVNAKRLRGEQRREATKKRSRTGESEVTITVGDTTLTGKGLFAPDNFGEAKRNEFSSAYTNRATFDPGQTSLANSRVMAMAQGSVTIDPTSPRYFDELAYVANRHVTGDPLTTMLLQGADNTKVAQWMATPGGQRYLERMGWDRNELVERIVDTVADQRAAGKRVPVWDEGRINTLRNVLTQYFPTEESRHAVLRGETTAADLRAVLADVPAENLSPIQGRAVEYAKTGQANLSGFQRIIDKLWDNFASKPENVISRWPFAQKAFKREMQTRLQMMAEQGIKVSSREWNAIQRSVTQEVLKESKQTFYNITRYNNAVYAARYVLVYPQAVFNTMWRAARFAYLRPGSAMVMNNAWTQAFTSHGVDANGEYTNNYSDVETIVYTVPEALSNLGIVDREAKMPAKAWQLLSDKQGATWTIQIPAQAFLMHQPTSNEMLKEALGPFYETVFPFGTPSGLNDYTVAGIPVGALIPNYFKSGLAALQVDREKLLRVQTQIHEYELALYYKAIEEGRPAKRPTPQSSSVKARAYWLATGMAQFTMSGGGGLQAPGQIELDGIRRIMERYGYDREAALPEIIQQYPNLDPAPLIQTTSEYRAYVPSTVPALAVIKDPEVESLLRQVTKNGNGDPEMVELLVADKVGPFDANVYDTLGALPVPGDSMPIRVKTDPSVVEGRVEAEKSWAIYNANKNAVMAVVAARGLKSMPDAMQQAWNAWLDDFKSKPENKTWAAQYGNRDSSSALRAVDTLTAAIDDPGMAKHRKGSYWIAAKKYLANLAPMVQAYRDPRLNSDQRDALKLVWDTWVHTNLGAIDNQFIRMYEKHMAEYDLEI